MLLHPAGSGAESEKEEARNVGKTIAVGLAPAFRVGTR